jgi:hypothetical protein
MSRASQSCTQLFGLITAIILGASSSVVAALGQSAPAELSSDCSAYASIPLPTESEKIPIPKKPPTCASYRSYRGIGRPVNYAEARACAWQERLANKAHLGQNGEVPTAWVVGGSLILADIYYNGAGVRPNVPLAMRFACEFEVSTAEVALEHLAKRGGSPEGQEPFEFCDYAETTFTMNFCSGYQTEIADDNRDRYFKSVESSMSPEQKAAFEKLLAARDSYIESHAAEVNQGGTIRTMRTIGSESILKDLFRTELVHFERKDWPDLTAAQIAAADSAMQREYESKLQKLRGQTKEDLDEGAVSAENLSKVQAKWEDYRSAWVAFARVRYPAEADAIRAAITLDRFRLLKSISSY